MESISYNERMKRERAREAILDAISRGAREGDGQGVLHLVKAYTRLAGSVGDASVERFADLEDAIA